MPAHTHLPTSQTRSSLQSTSTCAYVATPTTSLHEHNEHAKADRLIELLAKPADKRSDAERNEVFVSDDFRANESALKIAMNHAGRLRCSIADFNRPGAYFFWASSKITLKP